MVGVGAAQGSEGDTRRPFPMAVLCLIRSCGLPASFILNVGSICVARKSRQTSLYCVLPEAQGVRHRGSPLSLVARGPSSSHCPQVAPTPQSHRGVGGRGVFGRH